MAVKKTKKETESTEEISEVSSTPNTKNALKALQLVKNRLKKNMELNDKTEVVEHEVVSTGSAIIDDATGIGGLATSRVYMIYGPSGSGKSSICYSLISQFQKAYPEKMVAYFDAEVAVSIPYMQQFGVDLDMLDFQQLSVAEEVLSAIDAYAESGACSLIVLDSIPALLTKAQLEKGIDAKTMASLAGVLTPAINRIKDTCKRTNTTLVLINQTRAGLSMYGPSETIPGGNALVFFSSMILRISKKDTITEGDNAIGNEIQVAFKKNKLGSPYKVVSTKLLFGKGFDFHNEYVDMALSKEIITRGGAYYTYPVVDGTSKSLGKLNCVLHYKNNEIDFETLKKAVDSSDNLAIGEITSAELNDED